MDSEFAKRNCSKWFQSLRSGSPLECGIARLDFNKINVCIKGPAKRDYIPDLNKLRYASRRPAN
jgi:hypothetical protein